MGDSDTAQRPIVVATRDAAQLGAIRDRLAADFAVVAAATAAECTALAAGARLLLVDGSIGDAGLVPMLQDLLPRCEAPVVLLTAPDDLADAAVGVEAGAFTSVPKVPGYERLLEAVARRALSAAAERAELTASVGALQERIAQLEQRLPPDARPEASPPPAQAADASPSAADPGAAAAAAGAARRPFVERLVARLRSGDVDLPARPEIQNEMLALIESGGGVAEVATLLQKDAAVTAGLIRVANGTHYRGARPTVTLEDAVSRLGIAVTESQVEMLVMRALYGARQPHYAPLLGRIWRHALASAHAAQGAARALRLDQRMLFTAGLLHDIGCLLLVQLASEMEVQDGTALAPEALQVLLATHHAGFGNALMRRWRLPEQLCTLVANHENALETPDATRDTVALYFADRMAAVLGATPTDRPQDAEAELAKAAERLGLTPAAVEEIRETVVKQVENADSAGLG